MKFILAIIIAVLVVHQVELARQHHANPLCADVPTVPEIWDEADQARNDARRCETRIENIEKKLNAPKAAGPGPTIFEAMQTRLTSVEGKVAALEKYNADAKK